MLNRKLMQILGMHEKLPKLMQILRSKPPGTRVIIFCSTKRMCDQLSGQLTREFHASAIHGDKRQQVSRWLHGKLASPPHFADNIV